MLGRGFDPRHLHPKKTRIKDLMRVFFIMSLDLVEHEHRAKQKVLA